MSPLVLVTLVLLIYLFYPFLGILICIGEFIEAFTTFLRETTLSPSVYHTEKE
jgi:hypothetical protein